MVPSPTSTRQHTPARKLATDAVPTPRTEPPGEECYRGDSPGVTHGNDPTDGEQHLNVSAQGSNGLYEACANLLQHIAELAGTIPFAACPTPEEIAQALPGDDLVLMPISLPGGETAWISYLETIADEERMWTEVVKPLVSGTVQPASLPRAESIKNWNDLQHRLLAGCIVLLPATGSPLGIEMVGIQQRTVGEPTTERQIIGPKEAFVEKLEANVGLIRNRLRDPALRIEYHVVGRRSRTRVALLYLEDVANPEVVKRTRAGLRSIAVDFIRTEMDVAELTFQHGWSTFPLVEQTERPDRVAHGLSQGRIALIVEGLPFVLVVPVTFMALQHDGESALPGPLIGIFVRLLRLSGLFMSVALPGAYVAVLSADPLVLPAPLARTLAATRLAIPYPVATEVILMLVTADILAEATAQSASAIGNALAIVGTLIVGQLMVQAHLASSLLMIVVAISIMGSFLTLKFTVSYAIRIWKYAFVLLGAIGGLFGLFTGLLVLLIHLASLESAGVPYLAPIAASRGASAAIRAVMPPSRGQVRRRPAEYQPRQSVAARKRGRRP